MVVCGFWVWFLLRGFGIGVLRISCGCLVLLWMIRLCVLMICLGDWL